MEMMSKAWRNWGRTIGVSWLAGLALVLSIAARAKVGSEKDWPRQIEVPKGTIIIYQPQLEMFNGVTMKGRCALAVTPKGAVQPAWGALWFEAQLSVDRDQRLASILELKIPKARFAGSTPEQEKKLTAFIEEEIPKWNLSISLDRLLAGLNGSGREIMAQDRLNETVPQIIVSQEPAVLIPICGAIQMTRIGDTRLMRVVNSPFQIVFDPSDKTYYLNGGSAWFATQNIRTAWAPVERAPAELEKFYTFWTRGGTTAPPAAAAMDDKPPYIVAATGPTELIVFNGPPQFQPIANTDLFYAGNTESDVLMDGKTQQIYVLLEGRWFKAATWDGPWQFVPSDTLPAGFARIPTDSPKQNVLTHVSGTTPAEEAVLDTQVPQTAVISTRKAFLTVTYDGNPVFKPIDGFDMQYAVNTDFAVFSTGGQYYCCHEAIWYQAEKAEGPWKVCVSVPDRIYSMPPSCPLYYVKFVRIYQVMPESVLVGYTPGYLGCYRSSSDTIVYGTGYTYPEWFQSQYVARPLTWSVRARYNPLSGAWGLHPAYVSPGGKYRIIPGSVDGGGNRITKWSTAGWWGAGGYRDTLDLATEGRNADAARIRRDEQAKYNVYARYEATMKAESVLRRAENIRFAELKEATVPKANPNNVFVDRMGDVYRRTDAGWQKRQGTIWVNVRTTGSKSQSQLNAEYQKRERGFERERNQ